MDYIYYPNILYSCLFMTFVNFMYDFTRSNRKGSSQNTRLIISIHGNIGRYVELAYLIVYGIHTVWWAPLLLFGLSLISVFLVRKIILFIGWDVVSSTSLALIVSFIGSPLFGILSFLTIP